MNFAKRFRTNTQVQLIENSFRILEKKDQKRILIVMFLQVLLGFFMQLWMYASCVVYPLSIVPEQYRWLYALNPMVFIIEAFRFAFMGQGTVDLWQIIVSFAVSLLVVIVGIALFNKTERTCVDII